MGLCLTQIQEFQVWMESKGVFRSQSNIRDGVFWENSILDVWLGSEYASGKRFDVLLKWKI